MQGPHSIRLPVVRRVEDDRGSHIEPPLDQSWPEAERLAWHAAVVSDEIGMPVHLWSHAGDDRADLYAIGVGGSSAAAYSYDRAWTLLSGIASGVRAERSRRADRDIPEEMVEKAAGALRREIHYWTEGDAVVEFTWQRIGTTVQTLAKVALAAALEGCAVVQLPEPEADTGTIALWRPGARDWLVIEAWADSHAIPLVRVSGSTNVAYIVRERALAMLAAAERAERMAAEQTARTSGSGVGEQP